MLSVERDPNDLKFDNKTGPLRVDVPINCLLTINRFSGKTVSTSPETDVRKVLVKRKTKNRSQTCLNINCNRIFDYEPLSEEEATRGTLGIATSPEHVRKLSVLGHIFQGS